MEHTGRAAQLRHVRDARAVPAVADAAARATRDHHAERAGHAGAGNAPRRCKGLSAAAQLHHLHRRGRRTHGGDVAGWPEGAGRPRAGHRRARRALDAQAMDRAGRSQDEWDGQRLFRVPHSLAGRPHSSDVVSATFLVEASAKRLNGKDRDSTAADNSDYMRGGGFHDPSRNPNSYPMTGATPFRSAVTVRVNGESAGRWELPDDPADSRGILSWDAQPHDGHLYEAGSYGELLRIALPSEVLAAASRAGEFVMRLEVSDSLPGGLAIYGARFGRYPVDPTIIFELR